ncbi:hypothetical protein SAMN05444583_1155 [Rhodococcus maanshanensis]|uniref:Uncharacterized protein n=2 Tax=Rhodococcus maanshanensis TaxID=183556 RepID=A0A1H7T565_9NOCA|nr:hypothetical protein SAMN05444583_1155 [Rhodococcus maanshanensis]
MRMLAGAVATATVAVTMLAMPATASAAPTVQKPTMTTTLDGSNLTISLGKPAFDYKPVLGTPGAPNAVMTLLGLDAGSLAGIVCALNDCENGGS